MHPASKSSAEQRAHLIRRLFVAVGGLGLGVVLFGLVMVPVLPYFQLDAVLDPEELRDPAVRGRTLALLQRARGNLGAFATLVGLILAAIGGLGHRAASLLIVERDESAAR